MEAEVPQGSGESYADDKQALVRSRAAVTQVANITQNFADMSGQTLSSAKSYAFTTVEGGRKRVQLASGKVAWKTSARVVGANLTFQGQPEHHWFESKVNEACTMAQRIAWLPLGFQIRALIMEGLVVPR
eukprot:12408266-Karenia_brevis.AAC.1